MKFELPVTLNLPLKDPLLAGGSAQEAALKIARANHEGHCYTRVKILQFLEVLGAPFVAERRELRSGRASWQITAQFRAEVFQLSPGEVLLARLAPTPEAAFVKFEHPHCVGILERPETATGFEPGDVALVVATEVSVAPGRPHVSAALKLWTAAAARRPRRFSGALSAENATALQPLADEIARAHAAASALPQWERALTRLGLAAPPQGKLTPWAELLKALQKPHDGVLAAAPTRGVSAGGAPGDAEPVLASPAAIVRDLLAEELSLLHALLDLLTHHAAALEAQDSVWLYASEAEI